MKQRKVVGFFRGILFLSATVVALTLGSASAYAAPADENTQSAGVVTSGIVRDAQGEPIIGANVVEKGTSNGTITDFEGKFSFKATRNATLVVSYVGMKDQEVRASKDMIVNLREDLEVLEEVVVVGYGTQKKANLTGAVSSVDVSKTLDSKSMADVGKALQGTVPGLTIVNKNGTIDSDPEIVIRGTGSLSGATAPLYVVDGVPVENLGYLNPADIESISVLKDASSTSIYGTKAAFGVVLITTKTAKDAGKCTVTYSNNFAWSQATDLPQYSDVMTQITANNEANYNMGLESELFGMLLDTERYQEGVKKAYDYYGGKKQLAHQMIYGIDYDEKGYYTDWDIQGIFFNNAAPSQSHNLSVQGNSGKTQYYMSLGYNQQQSLLNYHPDKMKRYNATVNLSTKANEWLTVGTRFNYTHKTSTTASTNGGSLSANSYQYLWRWGSYFGPYGYWEDEVGNKIYGQTFQGALANASDATAVTSMMRAGGFFKIDFVDTKDHKFNFNGDYTFTRRDVTYTTSDLLAKYYKTWGMLGEDPTPMVGGDGYNTEMTESNRWYQRHVMNAYFNYNGTFAKNHHLNVMVGANLDKDEQKYVVLRRQNLMDYDKIEMNLTNDTTAADVSGCYHTHNGSLGFFGRINYDYKGIYLIELNGRLDGSSKFPTNDQWGFFPSASIGYRLSEEAYFEKAREYVSNMKIRASYGTIGNQEIGAGRFLETMAKYDKAVSWLNAGGSLLGYVGQPAMVSSTLTWETIATTNIGLDLGFLKNTLNVTFDWFQRDNRNMLAPAKELPSIIGQSAAWENAGSMRTRGWELTIDWRDRFNDWTVYATANLSDYKTTITKWDSNGLLNENYAGKEYGAIWGFQTDRYFTADDFNADGTYKDGVADQTLLQGTVGGQSFVYGPGDIKFVDQNGDGVIDWGEGTEEDHGDLIKIGNSTPRFQYSLRAGFDYAINKGKGGNLDLDLFFQGVGKRSVWTQSAFVMPFMRGVDATYANMTSYVTRDMIDKKQIDQNADFPRMWGGGAAQGNCKVISMGSGNFYPQTKYLVNMAYLRLKNITLGYTLPRELTRKATIDRVRVYGSILNPFDIINHNHGSGIDPEVNDGVGSFANGVWGRTEPIYRTYSVGIQVEF